MTLTPRLLAFFLLETLLLARIAEVPVGGFQFTRSRTIFRLQIDLKPVAAHFVWLKDFGRVGSIFHAGPLDLILSFLRSLRALSVWQRLWFAATSTPL